MSNSRAALDHARAETQALHKQLEKAATKNEPQKPAHSRKAKADAQHRSEMAKTKS